MTSDASVSPDTVQSVRKELSRRTFPAGATIFSEGDTGTVAYVLLRGNVTVSIGLGTPHQRTVAELKPGEMFGVHTLMTDVHRTTSAVTPDGCELLAVSEAKLRQKLDEADPFLRYWVEYLSKRVVDLSAP
jgi:CRP/FNR family cyclic AMP-dependent transcriptional regulator